MDVDVAAVTSGLEVAGETFATFVYDGLDRCVRTENDFASCEYTYNSLGWAVSESVTYTTQAAPFNAVLTLDREFDDAGMITGITYPGGRRLSFSRDALGRPSIVRNVLNGSGYPGGNAAAYDLARISYVGGQRAARLYHTGASTRYAYDAGGRLIEIAHGAGGASLLTLQYVHDAVGCTRLRHEMAPGADEGERCYYDSLYRLTAERQASVPLFDSTALAPTTEPPHGAIPARQPELDQLIGAFADPGGEPAFDYDLTGNRTREREPGGHVADYLVDALDQYTTRDGTTLRYDPNGNLVDDGTRHYVYDAQDRLVRIEDTGGGVLARYDHDPRGRRVLEVEAGVATHLFHDAAHVIAEYRDGQLFASYVYDDGLDRPLQIATGGAEAWYHQDAVGSVRLLTDRAGSPLASYRYTAFGVQSEVSGAVYNPLRFCARRRPQAIDTYDFRARQYDPVLGRFLQRDPAGPVDSTNPYTYARNAPLNGVDPWGTETRQEINRQAIETYVGEERKELAREFVRHSDREGAFEVFAMYGSILDEIEKSALESRPMDLNGLWEKGQGHDWSGYRLTWLWMCSRCLENPPLDKTGPFRTANILGVDVPAVFTAVIQRRKPNPSWADRLTDEVMKAVLLFGPGLFEGAALRASAETSMARAGLRPALITEAEAQEAAALGLKAEALGGTRLWLVGPEGASTTRGLRIVGDRITYDTIAPAKAVKVRQDMGALSNHLGLRGDGFFRRGTWWTGTHGTPTGEFGGVKLWDEKLIRTDRQIGHFYNWDVQNVYDYRQDPARILSFGLERPTVYAWCFSSSCFLP
jgi:RHS repeat-associated protein